MNLAAFGIFAKLANQGRAAAERFKCATAARPLDRTIA